MQPGGRSKHVRQACKVQTLISRYWARGVLGQATNFAGGVFVGGIIVLFGWLLVG